MVKENIIFDFDGTLQSNVFSELSYGEYLTIPFEEKVGRIKNSGYYESAKIIMNELKGKYNIYIVTGRSEDLREVSEEWLNKYNFIYDELIMIPEEWKTIDEYYTFKIKEVNNIKPIIVIDDSIVFLGKVIAFSFKVGNPIGVFYIRNEKSWNFKFLKNIINNIKEERNRSK